MQALRTQFDNNRLSNAVATPTCSSCCCCCCCVATSISATSVLAQQISKEGKKNKVPNRSLFTALAVLFVPIVSLIVYLIYRVILPNLCSYSTCEDISLVPIVVLSTIACFSVIWFLYAKVGVKTAGVKAMLATVIIAVCFTVEFFAGLYLLFANVSVPVYLILAALAATLVSVVYRRYTNKQVY